MQNPARQDQGGTNGGYQMNLELHPLCTLFPRMAGAEFAALVADIKDNGQREPIIIHDGMILDGGNRYRACVEAGVEPQTMKFGGGNIVAYVLSANLHRRHLSAGQHAAIVSSCQNWAEAHPVGKAIKCKIAPLTTAADRASVSGTSLRTQKSADKVAKADPGLAVAVGHGDISLPKAVAQIEAKTKPAKAIEPTPEPEYTELDALRDQVAELQDQLAAAHDKDSTAEEKALHGELVASLREDLKKSKAMVDALTRSRDQLMRENSQLKKQVAMMQKQAKKAR